MNKAPEGSSLYTKAETNIKRLDDIHNEAKNKLQTAQKFILTGNQNAPVPGEIVGSIPEVKEEINLEDQFPTPGDDSMYVPPVETNTGKNTSSLVSETGLSLKDGVIVDAQGNPIADVPPPPPEAKNKIEGLLKDYFGLEGKDIVKALGYYLMSRATGASHAGSMRWAGGVVLDSAAKRETKEDALEAKNAKDQKTIEALVKAGYSRAQAESYVTSGVEKLLEKPSSPFKTGQEVIMGVTGVRGLENISGYQVDYGKAGGGKYNLFELPKEDGTFETLTEPQLRAYISKMSGGKGQLLPYDKSRDTIAGRQEEATKFIDAMSDEVTQIFAGKEDKVKAETSIAFANGAQYMQDKLGYSLNNPGVQSAARVILLTAMREMRDDIDSGRIKRADSAAPYIKRSILTSAALGPGLMWQTADEKSRVNATKTNKLYSDLANINKDPAVIKSNFIKLHQTFSALKNKNELPKQKLNKKTENEFYVWIRNTLDNEERTKSILGE